jgi:hypothetical protein
MILKLEDPKQVKVANLEIFRAKKFLLNHRRRNTSTSRSKLKMKN